MVPAEVRACLYSASWQQIYILVIGPSDSLLSALEVLEEASLQGLCEEISNHVGCWSVVYFHPPLFYLVGDVEILDVNSLTGMDADMRPFFDDLH